MPDFLMQSEEGIDPLSGAMLVFDERNQFVMRVYKDRGQTPTLLLTTAGLDDGVYDAVVFNRDGRGFKRQYRVENPRPAAKVTPVYIPIHPR